MTSRERLFGALKGQKIDRVPISTYELVGYSSRSFYNNQPSYASLMATIREKTDCMCMWNPSSNASILGTAHPVRVDRAEVPQPDGRLVRHVMRVGGRELTMTTREIDGIYTVWHTERWCKSIADVDALMSIPYETPVYNDSDFARVRAEVGDHGLILPSIGDPAIMAMELMEFGEAMIWAMTETEHFARTMDKLHERNMLNLERMVSTRPLDLYRICGPEYLTPPYLPPSFFERFVTPYVKEIVALLHAHGCLARVHCHGRIADALDGIISTGADALDPIEAPPDGDITLAEVARRAEGRVTLMGNLQLKLLEHGTPQSVRDAVSLCMESAKDTGRFVIMPTAGPINVPLSPKTQELYEVFIDTSLELGAY